jgi:hypothetical protein
MTNPVTPPSNATAYLNLEAQPGWTANDSSSIGPHPLVIKNIVQVTPPPVQPPTTLTFETQGTPGDWCDVMYTPKAIPVPPKTYNCLIRVKVTRKDWINSNFEFGRRKTDENGVTDNGELQFVPLWNAKPAYSEMEFDLVPSGTTGGWVNPGAITFPTPAAGATANFEAYYINDPDGACSLQYISMNGDLRPIPAEFQHIAGAKLNWAKNEAVAAIQIDANPTATMLTDQIEMSIWFW